MVAQLWWQLDDQAWRYMPLSKKSETLGIMELSLSHQDFPAKGVHLSGGVPGVVFAGVNLDACLYPGLRVCNDR